MIDLGNGYFVAPTNYGYNLVVDKGQKNKAGETVYFAVSYHGSLASAIAAAMQEAQRKTLASDNYTLQEAVKTLERIQNDFRKLLIEAVGGKEDLY